MIALSKAALFLSLVPSMLASPHVQAHAAPHSAGHRAAASFTAVHTVRHPSGVAVRATERKLLLYASRQKLLRRFVDPTTGLVKRNVAARCSRLPRRPHDRLIHYLCRVWTQPRLPSSGVAVICFTRRGIFLVRPYRGWHRYHR